MNLHVEADESLDLDGVDAAHKAVILAYLAHGLWVTSRISRSRELVRFPMGI